LANEGVFIRVAGLEISGGVRLRLKQREGKAVKERKTPAKRGEVGRSPEAVGGEARAGTTAVAEGGVAPGGANEKYQRILDAAVEVIAENGYFNSPVSAIAARAGVADGTIYLYFKSKDDVLRTAIDTTFDRFHQQLLEKFETMTDPREQLEYIARVHLESSTKDRSMAILMQTEMRQSANFIAEFSHKHLVRYIQVVREVVRRGQQSGVFRQDVSDGLVAHCMFGAIDELLSSAVFTHREYDAKVTAAQVMDVLWNGIGTGAASRTETKA
jgi:TetR/AcrR family fatty acid metabolism transcriptional regulator